MADLLFLASGESYNWRDSYDKIDTKDLSTLAAHLYFASETVDRELSKRNVKVPSQVTDTPRPEDKDLLDQTIAKYSGTIPFPEPFEQWLTSEFHIQSTRLGNFLKTLVQRDIIEPAEKANPTSSCRPAIYRASKLEMCLVALATSSCMGPASAILLLYAIVNSKLKARSPWELAGLVRYLWQTRDLTPCLFFRKEADLLMNNHDHTRDPNFSSLSSGSQIFLALLICFGGNMVPELVFKRFLERQFRWSPKGDRTIAELGWTNEGPGVKLTNQLIGVLNDKNRTSSETQLLSRSWLQIEIADGEGSRSSCSSKMYSVPDDIKKMVMMTWNDQICVYWHKIAFQLICHVFPRDAAWETSFQDHGKLLVPCLDHVVNFFNGDDLTEQMKLMLAESLDAKARLAGSRRNTMCKEGNI